MRALDARGVRTIASGAPSGVRSGCRKRTTPIATPTPPGQTAEGGIVDAERQGLWACYSVLPEPLDALSAWLG